MADLYSGFVGRICVADLYGGFVWRILVVKFVWRICRADLRGGFVWRICMADFGGEIYMADFGRRSLVGILFRRIRMAFFSSLSSYPSYPLILPSLTRSQ